MAMRRKQQRSKRVVATPHPPRTTTRSRSSQKSAQMLSAASDAAATAAAAVPDLDSSPILKPHRDSRRSPARRDKTRTAGKKRRSGNMAIPLEPRAKRKRAAATAAAGGGGDDSISGEKSYADQLASAGFVCPPLATSEPAFRTHVNRPSAPTNPPVARRQPLTIEEARKLTKDDPPVRVYADGVFDLFHYGHAQLLMQAKQMFANVCLVSGIPNDTIVNQMKGQTVLTAEERMTMMLHCRYVDEVIEDAPYTPTLEFLEKHNIDFVAHDAKPLSAAGKVDIYAEVKEAHRFVGTKRTEGISTSDIIARIVRNYDTYVRRNLSRGYPRQDMGLSYVREQGVKARGHMGEMMQSWKGRRHSLIGGFLGMFGPVYGPISSLFKNVRAAPDHHSASQSPTSSGRSLGGRFDDFFDDFEEEQDDDDVRPWSKETTEFLLSESEGSEGSPHDDDDQAD